MAKNGFCLKKEQYVYACCSGARREIKIKIKKTEAFTWRKERRAQEKNKSKTNSFLAPRGNEAQGDEARGNTCRKEEKKKKNKRKTICLRQGETRRKEEKEIIKKNYFLAQLRREARGSKNKTKNRIN